MNEKDAIIKKQNHTLLHIGAELEFIRQHPFDVVLIGGSIENISNIINGQTEPIIDEGHVEGCKVCAGSRKVIDVAAGLQKELDACRKLALNESRRVQCDTELIEMLHTEIESREAELFDFKNSLPSNFWAVVTEKDSMIRQQGKTIEELKDKNIEDLKEMYDFHEGELEWFKDELSARKEDSEVLMKVVEIVKEDKMMCGFTLNAIADLLVNYLDAPEGPPETPIDEPQEITVTFAFLELP